MRRLRTTVGCFAVSGAFALGAVGATSVGAYATDDACKLLSTKMITKVLGQQPGTPLGQNDPGLSTCIWDLAASGDLVRVNLVTTISGPPTGKAEFDTAKTSPTEAKVPGIKKAYFDSSAREIMALRGDTLVKVQLLKYTPDGEFGKPPEPELIKLAKVALKKYQS